jgi:hypothetical protein
MQCVERTIGIHVLVKLLIHILRIDRFLFIIQFSLLYKFIHYTQIHWSKQMRPQTIIFCNSVQIQCTLVPWYTPALCVFAPI